MCRKPVTRAGRAAPALENVLSALCGWVTWTVCLYICPLGKGVLAQLSRSYDAEIT